jgi:polyisoprenoid-binding protein YceI
MRASVLGPEFLDAERHPEITFRSTELPGGGDAVGWDVEVDIDLLLKREGADAHG